MLCIANQKGQHALPFIMVSLVFLLFITYAMSEFSAVRLVNSANTLNVTNGNQFNESIVNTNCGGNVLCALGNLNALTSYSSDFQLFAMFILTPLTIGIVLIGYVLIRGGAL